MTLTFLAPSHMYILHIWFYHTNRPLLDCKSVTKLAPGKGIRNSNAERSISSSSRYSPGHPKRYTAKEVNGVLLERFWLLPTCVPVLCDGRSGVVRLIINVEYNLRNL